MSADRMITAGDIQYEPPQTKIYLLGPRVFALTAGDLIPQSAICKRTFAEFQGNSNASVLDVAEGYARHFVDYLRNRNVAEFLTPVGLTLEEFHKNLAKENTAFTKDTLRRLYSSELETETIIAGIDALGPHIYKVIDPTGVVETHDDVGFASIGVGAWHAQSQFMQMAYTRTWSFPWTLFLIYLAMKRSQIAPGVGKAIDMWMIGPQQVGELTSDPIFKTLEEVYANYGGQEFAARLAAFASVQTTFEEYLERAKEAAAPQGQGKADADKEGISGGTEEGESPTA